jgi:hypothetical protein
MKESLEAEFIYLISIAFFLALRVEDKPVLGSSHNSMAFYFNNLVLSLSFMAKSISKETIKSCKRIHYLNFPHHR